MTIYVKWKNGTVKRLNLSEIETERIIKMAREGVDSFERELKPVDFHEDLIVPANDQCISLKFDLPDDLSKLFDRQLPSIKPFSSKDIGKPFPVALLAYTSKDRLWVQSLTAKNVLTPKRFALIVFAEKIFSSEDNMLAFDPKKTDAIYVRETGELRFKNLSTVDRIFDLSDYIADATDAHVREYFGRPEFNVNNIDKIPANLTSMYRRKLNVIRRSEVDVAQYEKTIKKLQCQGLVKEEDLASVANGKIIIPDNLTIVKELIKILNNDYLREIEGEQIFEATSKRPLKSKA